jgi:hypothetical protein
MSLTSRIRSNSNVKRFFKKYFPEAEPFIKYVNADINRYALRDGLPVGAPGHVYGWVGTAFDYRARYYLKFTKYESLMAAQGGKVFGDQKEFEKNINAWLKKATQKSTRQTKALERDICLICLLLAKLEVVGRSQGFGDTSLILGQEHYPIVKMALTQKTIKDILVILRCHYPKDVVADLMRLSSMFRHNLKTWEIQWAELNPLFLGSPDVDGADADVVVNGVLIDFKCKKRKISINDLFQLIGYKILDYGNWYKIHAVGIYWGRQGQLRVWDFKRLLTALGCPSSGIRDLRKRFKRAAEKDLKEAWGYY